MAVELLGHQGHFWVLSLLRLQQFRSLLSLQNLQSPAQATGLVSSQRVPALAQFASVQPELGRASGTHGLRGGQTARFSAAVCDVPLAQGRREQSQTGLSRRLETVAGNS